MSQMPDIKPELNKGSQPEQEEKKRGGFFANLFSKAPGGGLAAGGSGVAGGILATKAGIVGLAIIGTAVAGGIGYVGYRAMMPSSEPQTLSIFEARPKSALPADEQGRQASGEGVSGSLDMFAKANSPDEGKPSESAAQVDPAAESSASPAGSAVDHGDASLSGPAASIPKPQFTGKIGQLSGSTGGSGTSAAFSAGSASGPQFGASKKGSISGMSGGSGARASGVGTAGARSLYSGRWRGRKLAGAIKKDQKGGFAKSSAAAGRTWDGNNAAPASFGTEGGVPEGGAGPQDGAGDLSGQPSTAVNDKNEEEGPPPAKPKDVTPWAKELNMAKMLLMGASAILLIAAMLEKGGKLYSKSLVNILAIIGGLMAGAAMLIGFKIAGGEFGQKSLGTILGLSGGLLVLTAIGLIASKEPGDKQAALSNMGWLFQLSGALGIVGAISTNFLKPVTITCDKCKGDDSCKKDCGSAMNLHLPGGAPSDRAMDKFVA